MSTTTAADQAAAPVVSESPAVIQRWERDFSVTKTDGLVFDYIIVGSGSAGAVLASRLSEDQTKQVLLIEAGGVDTKDEIHMPAACGNCQRGEIDWKYKSVPQKHSHLACDNQQSNWPRGKVLGGCSSINYMQFVRGDPHDYDNWNLPDWSFEVMLKYFRKLERADPNQIPRNEKYRNHDPNNGFVDATMLEDANELNEMFIQSSLKHGFHRTKDYNAEETLNGCVSVSQVSTKSGKRWSTASAYLLSAVKRNNFHLLIHAHTCRVVFDDAKQATGVIVRRDQSIEKEELIRGKEIILSAGTIGSPQILLLSGIGPREELEKHQIPLIVHSPGVGKNLQDHLFTPLYYLTSTPTLCIQDLNEANLTKWATQGRGVLTSCIVECQSWCQLNPIDGRNVPDIQTHFTPFTIDQNIFDNFNYQQGFYEKYFQKHLADGQHYTVNCLPTLLHPKSRGEVTLSSANPLDPPKIDPNYLSEREDVDRLIQACQLLEKICADEPLKDVLQPFHQQLNAEHRKEDNEKTFWESYIRKFSLTVYHPVGTCRMGEENDPMTVVTPSTKVKGVQGLRVIDASIMPSVPSGNTNIPTIALAERAADLIKSDH